MSPALRPLLVLSIALLFSLSGCSKGGDAGASPAAATANNGGDAPSSSSVAKASRKVIRNAELGMSVTDPARAGREAQAIAEANGGYLASTTSLTTASEDGQDPGSVRVVLRVASDKLDGTLEALRKLGTHVGSENITSKDVTEDWVDLDARLRTQKKLEEQYLEILKGATRVEDLLNVQKQLAEVRGEIEKLEGKRRVLDDQIALSSVTVTFQGNRPFITASVGAFGRAAKRASADAVNVSAGIVVGSIRLAGFLLPVVLFVLAPLYLFGRWLVRRLSARPLARA